MMINNRRIEYIGNDGWNVDGEFAKIYSHGAFDLRVPATGEIVALTAEQSAAIRAERDAARAPRVPVMRTTGNQSMRKGSFAEAMEGDAAMHGGRTGHRYSRSQRGY